MKLLYRYASKPVLESFALSCRRVSGHTKQFLPKTYFTAGTVLPSYNPNPSIPRVLSPRLHQLHPTEHLTPISHGPLIQHLLLKTVNMECWGLDLLFLGFTLESETIYNLLDRVQGAKARYWNDKGLPISRSFLAYLLEFAAALCCSYFARWQMVSI